MKGAVSEGHAHYDRQSKGDFAGIGGLVDLDMSVLMRYLEVVC